MAWQRGDEERGASLGVSGHYSRERPVDELLTSRAAALDFHLQGARFGVAGEVFVGDNIDAFGGALGQVSSAAGGFPRSTRASAGPLGGRFRRRHRSTATTGRRSRATTQPSAV